MDSQHHPPGQGASCSFLFEMFSRSDGSGEDRSHRSPSRLHKEAIPRNREEFRDTQAGASTIAGTVHTKWKSALSPVRQRRIIAFRTELLDCGRGNAE